MPFKFPSTSCGAGQAALLGGWNVACGDYACNGFESFTWRSGQTSITCTQEGQSTSFGWGTLYCPSPERFCRSVKLNEAHFTGDPFDENYYALQGPPPPITENPQNSLPTSSSVNYETASPGVVQSGQETPNLSPSDNYGSKDGEEKKKLSGKSIFIIVVGLVAGIIVIAVVVFLIVRCRSAQVQDSDDITNEELGSSIV